MIKTVLIPQWKKKYETGISEVDQQHQYFLELIKRLHRLSMQNLERSMVNRLLNEVLKYAEFHFYSEENLMMLHKYPDLSEHRKLHEELIDKLATKINYFATGKFELGNLVEFTVNWFINHTVEQDKKLTQFVIG